MSETRKVRNRIGHDLVFQDGSIALDTNLANGAVKYSYFDLGQIDLSIASLIFQLVATTLTLEATNVVVRKNVVLDNIPASGTDATGNTIVASTLNTVHGFTTNDDLNGALVEVIADTTTPANVGKKRLVADYVASSGTITFAQSLGAPTTSGVTTIKIVDAPTEYGRRADDPDSSKWADVTNQLLGAATFTGNGSGTFFGKPYLRFRIKRLTTNATNSSGIQLSRARE